MGGCSWQLGARLLVCREARALTEHCGQEVCWKVVTFIGAQGIDFGEGGEPHIRDACSVGKKDFVTVNISDSKGRREQCPSSDSRLPAQGCKGGAGTGSRFSLSAEEQGGRWFSGQWWWWRGCCQRRTRPACLPCGPLQTNGVRVDPGDLRSGFCTGETSESKGRIGLEQRHSPLTGQPGEMLASLGCRGCALQA